MKQNTRLTVFVVLTLFMISTVTSAQEPAAEFQSLLNMRYYEPNGGFLVDDLQLAFAPRGNENISFVVTRKTGEEVARVPLRMERLRTFEAFRSLHPNGVPGVIRIGQSGDFLMELRVGDRTITRMPISLKEEKSSDPYNPKTTFVREGPWRDVAYFSSPIDKPETPMKFNFWMSLRELPSGVKRPAVTVHVLLGGREIATTPSHVVADYFDWQFFKVELVQPKGVDATQWLTLESLKKRDGDLTIVLKANGQPFKTYHAQIRGGNPVGLPRNQMEFEPHTEFIPTRLVDLSRDGGCDYCMLDLFWVSKAGR